MVPPPPTPFARAITCYRVADVRKAIRSVSSATYKDLGNWSLVYKYCDLLNAEAREAILKELETDRLTRLKQYDPSKRGRRKKHPLNTDTPDTGPVQDHPPELIPSPLVDTPSLPPGQSLSSPDPAESHGFPSVPGGSSFLNCVKDDVLKACVVDFINRTGNDAFKQETCASCQRLLFLDDLMESTVAGIPNGDLLIPATPHHAHELSEGGMLLAGGPYTSESSLQLCCECLSQLKKGKRPKLSLANNMWIGAIPPELKGMTLPERILISLYFPSAYVVKLYSKKNRKVNWNDHKTQSGIKGNVSTYRLDQQLIADMVGLTMPPPVKILSATIAITYVGPNNITKACLPGTFRVRRQKVMKALRWLKDNNPLYKKITISDDRLEQLPTNDVPDEVFDVTRYSDDVTRLDEEHASYVPLNEEVDTHEFLDGYSESLRREDGSSVGAQPVAAPRRIPTDTANSAEDGSQMEVDPDVIPLQALGVIDVAGNDIPSDELFTHALVNTAGKHQGRAEYAIRHGSAFVSEYARKDPATGLRFDGGSDNPNHLLGSFPFLFPYGRGGFESDQAVPVTYESHARWAMQYDDRRFRLDPLFLFQVFGVIQKREVCRAAVLQVTCVSDAVQSQLRTLTEDDLLQAAQEEAQKKPFSNPAVRTLRKQMSAIRARVTGTDESRHSIRSKIWGTNLLFNSPSLWITINPPDSHDPIAQVLMGEEINLDDFCATAGPTPDERASNVAADPFGAALYFHRIIKIILESLFGITAEGDGKRIRRKEGIFGTVQAYVGTVEAQGRGTLHLHLLLWLKDTPGPQAYKDLLEKEEFVDKLRAFIRQNINADVNNMTTEELKKSRVVKECAYSRPLDPRSTDYDKVVDKRTKELARACQFHHCDERCHVYKQGRKVCKRGAPWPMAVDAWVSDTGHWGPKRTSGVLNNFNPILLTTLRCNHDIKLITQGSATRNIIWYITNYASKKQQKSSNSSALLAKRFAFHTIEENRNPNATDRNKRLLQRCANTLTRDREFSAPEVVSYLMGWGDRFESHFYVNLRWDAASRLLVSSYPLLKQQSERQWDSMRTGPTQAKDGDDDAVSAGVETYTLQFVGNNLELRNQLKEYAHRGWELEDYSFLKTFLDTYDAPYSERQVIIVDPSKPASTRGRTRHDRIPYLDSYGNPNRCRIRRARCHETLPRIVGKWFPRNNDKTVRDLYCASVLMLLKPWRSLEDLKPADSTFDQAFEVFMADAPPWVITVVDNIQHYYDCADQASAEASEDHNSMTYTAPLSDDLRQELGVVIPNLIDPTEGLTEEDVEAARRLQLQQRDRDYLDITLNIAESHGLNVPVPHQGAIEDFARTATSDEVDNTLKWQKSLKAITRASALVAAGGDVNDSAAVLDASSLGTRDTEIEASVTELVRQIEDTPDGGLKDILNDEQRRAHDIIVDCMSNQVKGVPQPQLLMIVHGQGGTGKSLLIQAITQSLERQDASQYLGKTATSGIASCPIGGNTVHNYFGLPVHVPSGQDWVNGATTEVKKRRVKNLAEKHMVFIDEMSMLTKANLACISEIAQVVRGQSAEGRGNSTQAFGGLHVVLFGDFHQFPPVAGKGLALYLDTPPGGDERSAMGREIVEQFEVVVFLTKQNRCRDPGWTELLDRSRLGECTDDDIDEVNKLCLTDPRCDVPDFNSAEWKDAILVTTRHCLRNAWNERALRKYAKEAGLHRYIIRCEDIDTATGDVPRIDFRVAAASMGWKRTGKLNDTIEIARGMKVMVLINIATEADVANGTRGIIEDFWLDPAEDPKMTDDGAIVLSKLPPVLFFRPNEPTKARFEGVPTGVIPLSPLSASFDVSNSLDQVARIKRRQYALTGAYAFTDYKSQGQTIEKVIIDLSKPPSGKPPDSFSAYVALSRGRGRDSIRLLSAPAPELLTSHPSEGLRREMERLGRLERRTTLVWEYGVDAMDLVT